jgi:hypothetical protein
MIPKKVQVEQIDFKSGIMKSQALPHVIMKGLHLMLKITHTNGASPSITPLSFIKLIDRLRVVINGEDNIINIKGYHLYYHNLYMHAQAAVNDILTTASTQVTSYLSVYLPFALQRAVRPEDTVLDARKSSGVSTIHLEIDWGTSIGSGVTSIDSGALQIWTDEYAGVPNSEKVAKGLHRMSFVSSNLDATGEVIQDLETGPGNEYVRLMVFALDSSGALDNDQLDNIGIKVRDNFVIKKDSRAIQHQNQMQYNVDKQTGIYILDFTTDGKMTQRLNAANIGELKAVLNSLVTNGSVEILREKAVYA